MQKDSFNVQYATDILTASTPGIEFVGAANNLSSGKILSGIIKTPFAAGNETGSVSGTQNLIFAAPGHIYMNSDSTTSNSRINLYNSGSISMKANQGNGDSSSSFQLSGTGINLIPKALFIPKYRRYYKS